MALSDYTNMAGKTFHFLRVILASLLAHKVRALINRLTYKPLPESECRAVVVVGGSFAGYQAVRFLCQTLPTGWRVVLVEPNSHLYDLFAFPRFSVVPGHERKAFIPYDSLEKLGPTGVCERIQGRAVEITGSEVRLAGGQGPVAYEYLVLATGTVQAPPSKLKATDKEDACEELRGLQENVRRAETIAIVGGGPVGVEVTTDIKSWFPEKKVTLIHSRAQLLNHFGKRLHEAAMVEMEKLGVEVLLEQRPDIVSAGLGGTLRFADGRESTYDYIIPCTGQTPNSSLLADLCPQAVSPDTKEILVKSTLQVDCGAKGPRNIYAIGDVARTGGYKQARASYFQAVILERNIIARIKSGTERKYVPNEVEGAIKLTLGKERSVMYVPDENGKDSLISTKGTPEDMEAPKIWGMFGAKYDPQQV